MDPYFFRPGFHGPHASRLRHKRKKKSVHNLPHRPRIWLIKVYIFISILYSYLHLELRTNLYTGAYCNVILEKNHGNQLAPYPTVVMVTKAHQNPSSEPRVKGRGNSEGFQTVSCILKDKGEGERKSVADLTKTLWAVETILLA